VDEDRIQDGPLSAGSLGISDMDIKGSLGVEGGGGVKGARQLGSAMLRSGRVHERQAARKRMHETNMYEHSFV
jgi:hypothetical protein